MSIVPPLVPPYVPNVPTNNITPFTYRDGVTYVEKLENLQTYVNTVIVEFINTNFDSLEDALVDQMNALIIQVNEALVAQATAVNTALAAQDTENDSKIAQLTADVAEAVANVNQTAADINAALVAQTAANDAALTAQDAEVTAQLAAMTTYVDEQVALILGNSITLQDDVMFGILSDEGSDSRMFLDSLYNEFSITDGAMAAVVADPDSETSNALELVYLSIAYGAIIDTGRLSAATLNANIDARAASAAGSAVAGINWDTSMYAVVNAGASATRVLLNSLYAPIGGGGGGSGQGFKQYATQALMIAATGIVNNDIAIVDAIPGAWFKRIASVWVMQGTAILANPAAITTAITAPANKMLVRLDSSDITYQYVSGVSRWIPFNTNGWNSYTPTTTGVTWGNAVVAFRWRIFDGTLQVKGHVDWGTTSTFTAGSNLIIYVPTNIKMKSTTANAGIHAGRMYVQDSLLGYNGDIYIGSADYFALSAWETITNQKGIGALWTGLTLNNANGDYFEFDFMTEIDTTTTTYLV